MGKSLPNALRERVVSFVEAGHSHRSAAAHFRVSPRFVNNLMLLKKETGSVQPRKQGRPDKGKLGGHHDWIRKRMVENGELTLDELCLELAKQGVHVHRSNVGRLLQRLGLSIKKPDRH